MPSALCGLWTELLGDNKYPKLDTLILNDCTMLRQLKDATKARTAGSSSNAGALSPLQQTLGGLRHLKLSHMASDLRNLRRIDNSALFTSVGTLDTLDLGKILPFVAGPVPTVGMLRSCQVKHVTLEGCNMEHELFQRLLQNDCKHLKTLTLFGVRIKGEGSWVSMFQTIPTACPNLINIEAMSLNNDCISHQARTVWLMVLYGSLREHDVDALMILLRTIGERRRVAGLIGTHLETCAQRLEEVLAASKQIALEPPPVS